MGAKVSTATELESIVGRRVKSLKDFVGVPRGTTGRIKGHYGRAAHQSIDVAWDIKDRPEWPWFGLLVDTFVRNSERDETELLEFVE